jgi:hypothetical protein
MTEPTKSSDYIPVADVEVSAVRPQRTGFTLQGTGADRAEYRVDLELEVPVDQRTRTVLGEILSQSKWRIWRRAPQPLRSPTRIARQPGKPASG